MSSTRALTDLLALPVHPAAELWPDLSSAEAEELARDIAIAGVRVPIVVLTRPAGDLLLDGRQRLRAAQLANLETVPVRIVDGDDATAIAEVAALNGCRRHLSPDQRVAIALRMEELLSRTARLRKSSAVRLREASVETRLADQRALVVGQAAFEGRVADLASGQLAGSGPPARRRESRHVAAAAVGLSARTVSRAKATVAAAASEQVTPEQIVEDLHRGRRTMGELRQQVAREQHREEREQRAEAKRAVAAERREINQTRRSMRLAATAGRRADAALVLKALEDALVMVRSIDSWTADQRDRLREIGAAMFDAADHKAPAKERISVVASRAPRLGG